MLKREIQIKPDEFVALYLDKTDSIISLILGMWKSGAAFVPIDKDYPDERVRFIVSDSTTRLIITNSHHKEKLQQVLGKDQDKVSIITIESLLPVNIEQQKNSFVKPYLSLKSTGKAYMTYTSGTTGIPKGVSKTHQSVVNSIIDLSGRYKMREQGTERVALLASYVFEPFMRQTLIALINGQVLVVVPDEIRLDPEYFPKFLNEQKITCLSEQCL